MVKFGYVVRFVNYDEADKDIKWMKHFGCTDIGEDLPSPTKLRPQWDRLMDSLDCGDVLVVPKLSHVVSKTTALTFFLEFCRIKGVRLISIHDRIDSGNELFPETRVSDVLATIAMLPKEIDSIRRMDGSHRKAGKRMKVLSPSAHNRAERNALVANMYKSGHSIEEIKKASGFSSRGSIFRVLNETGIKLNRRKRDRK